MHLAVVSAGVQYAGLLRRLNQRHDVAERLHAVVLGNFKLRRLHAHQRQAFTIGVLGQLAADRGPRISAIGGLEHLVGADVDGVRVVRRDQDRRVPVPAQRRFTAGRHRADRLALVADAIDARDVAILRFGVDRARVLRIDLRLEAVAAVNREPVVIRDTLAAAHRARAAPGVVVLQAAVDVVGRLHVVGDVVELPEVHVVDGLPGLGPVVADANAAVRAFDNVVRVVRVDPHRVVIVVQRFLQRECLAAVVRDVQVNAEHVDPRIRGWVNAHLAEVHRPRVDVRHLAPRLPRIVRPVRAAFLGVFDARVDDVRIPAVDVHADAAERAGGHAVGQLGPGPAGIARLPHRAAGPAAVKAPGGATTLIGRRVEHLVVGGIHDQLGGAGFGIDKQDAIPGEAAVSGLVDASFAAGAEHAAEGRHVDHFRINGIHDDAGDHLRGAEAHELEVATAVGGLVDAVAPRRALPVVVLAAAHPHGVGVVRVDGDVANRDRVFEIVEQHFPRRAVVHRLPQAPGGGADVEHGRIRLEDRQVVDAAAHGGRTDVAKDQAGKWISRCGGRRRCSWPLGVHHIPAESDQGGKQNEQTKLSEHPGSSVYLAEARLV